jgi:predicted PurR-regulated permease PerM
VTETEFDRARLGWWLFVLLLAIVAAYIARAFVGLLVLGVFGYYATRPICVRFRRVVNSRSLAAMLTVITVLLPILVLVTVVGIQLFTQLQQLFDGTPAASVVGRIAGLDAVPEAQRGQLIAFVRDPTSVMEPGGSLWANADSMLEVVQGFLGALLLMAIAVTLSYVLLANDGDLSAGLIELFGGRDTTAYAYAIAVDADLESVFFGNLLFAVVMAVVATATYAATNVVAPAGLQVPMVFVLGFLTGLASLIPIVVGKLVYVPVVAYLGFQATESGALPFVGAVLLVYFVVLDILPQTFVQPYLSGRKFNPVILLFAYLLGPVLFGWYGFFLLPILFVLMVEAIRIVLPELLHGEPIRPDTTVSWDVGADSEMAPASSEGPVEPDEAEADPE